MVELPAVAVSLLAVWVAMLSVVVLLAVRQIALLTARLDSGNVTMALDEDGLDVGFPVPPEAAQALPEATAGPAYVLLLSSNCGPCRELVPQLHDREFEFPLVALIPGRKNSVTDLVKSLPPGIRVVTDPAATDVATALQIRSTPFVLEVESGTVTGKAYLRDTSNLFNLMEARKTSDAAEVAARAKGAREGASA